MSSAALAGVTVIEMTEAMAGPYAAMMLGDLGADVIKVERPGVGDMSRGWGPPFLAGESAYYLSTNRNKRSLTLNLRHPEARAILDALIERSDIFLVNQPRLASLQSLGIDYERLRRLNPRLIYCSITGYGMTGPYAGRSGYDLAAQGEAGTMALTGEPDGPPVRYPVPISDITAGIYTVMAALTALYVRERTGCGQFIDMALLDSQLTWLTNLAGNYFATGQRPRKLGNYHPQIAPYEPFPAQDKPFLVAVGSERLWEAFCRVLGIEETVGTDPRFRTNADRLAHRFELRAELEPLFRSQPAEFWLSRLREAGIPCGAINEIDEALNDPHVQARGMIVTLEHPVIGPVRSLGNPMHLSLTPPSYRLPPPLLGQHTDEILQALGYCADDIARLRREGAI